MHEHDHSDRKFHASLHGRTLQEPDGRIHGSRQNLLAKIKARQRGPHR